MKIGLLREGLLQSERECCTCIFHAAEREHARVAVRSSAEAPAVVFIAADEMRETLLTPVTGTRCQQGGEFKT